MANTFSRHHSVVLRRNERERLLFIAAAGLAFSLLIIMLVVLNFKQKLQASETQSPVVNVQPVPMGTVTLYVPETEVDRGTKLSEVKFKEVFWPHHQVPANAVTDLAELKDMFAKMPLSASIPLQRTMLSAVPVRDWAIEVCDGCRAVTIEVDRSSAVEGHAEPGTFVDVVLTHVENGAVTSKVIVERARVLSKGGATEVLQHGRHVQKAEPTVTLEVLQKDALAIKTATQMGKLSLLLRDQSETRSQGTREIRAADIANPDNLIKREGPCIKGNARVGGKEYVIGCDGRMSELVEAN